MTAPNALIDPGRHSGGLSRHGASRDWNPESLDLFWVPAFAGMTIFIDFGEIL
jgi:hypothetical protein